jgi:predicted phage terminase large subunit-like protein
LLNLDAATRKAIAEQSRKELARRGTYADYVEYVHQGRWILSRHLEFVCHQVESFIYTTTGHPYDILILQMPPQHGKSQSITETLPSWYLGKWPERRVIEVSYNETFAQRFGRRNRDKIKEYGKQLFNIEISKGKDSNEEFELSNHIGGMISRGIMSGITGNPANLIIIDDPIKNREEADSENTRAKQWDEWQNSIKTRTAAGAKIIVIMTRWHEDDLAGRIIKSEKNVTVINLPCEAEEDDPIGRRPGEALFPEIGKDRNWLQQFKDSYINDVSGNMEGGGGPRAWNALYQGRPSSQTGNMLKRYWWRYWKPAGVDLPPVTVKDEKGEILNIEAVNLPTSFDRVLQSWDMTFKDTAGTDFVAGGVWASKWADIFYLDQIYERMDFPTTCRAVIALTQKWPQAVMKLVEDKANGPAVISMLRHRVGGLTPVLPEGSKQARASAVSPLIEAGNVYLPHPMIAPWVNTFIEQCAGFPLAAHDDLVDQMSQALKRFMFLDIQSSGSFLPGNRTQNHYDFNTELGRDEDEDDDMRDEVTFYG